VKRYAWEKPSPYYQWDLVPPRPRRAHLLVRLLLWSAFVMVVSGAVLGTLGLWLVGR
jgi:hypothetical protein